MATVSLDDKQAAYEERLRDQIMSIVNKYTGTGNAQVQVAADLDFSRVTKQSTVYDPDTQVVASTTSTEEHETSSDKQDNAQTVSVSNSLPNNQTPADSGSGGGTSSSNRSRTEEQTAVSKFEHCLDRSHRARQALAPVGRCSCRRHL